MAGLLDGFSDFIKTPEGQGLLSAAFGGLAGARRGQPINSIGRAGLAGLSGYSGAQDRISQEADSALKRGQVQAQIEAYQNKAKEESRVQSLLANFGMPKLGTGATGAAENALPPYLQIPGQPSIAPQNAPLDYTSLIRQGVPIEKVKALADARNFGMDKVARTQEIEGQNGAKVLQGYDDYGRPVGQGVNGYVAPVSVNQGDRTTFVKPAAGVSLPMNMSLSERDASARGWAGNRLAGERLAFDKSGGAEGVKPQYRDGQWVTPPSNMQPGQAVPAIASTAQKDAREALALITTAKQLIPKSTGSYLGAGVDQAARVFGASTGGDTAAAQLKALEGALVSKMPKMSGPQSDKDVLLYKQMAGEIGDPTIPGSRKEAALRVIEEIQQRHTGMGAQAAPGQSGATGGWGDKPATPAPSTPMRGMVRNGYKFKGGDPASQANWEKQ